MDKKTSADKTSPQAEALARKLQEKLKQERPRWYRWVPLVAVTLFGVLALFAWLIYPEPDPPRLTVTACDALHVAGSPAVVRAVLEPQEAGAKFEQYRGLEVVFWEERDGAQDTPRHKAEADEHGVATATLSGADGTAIAFHARHLDIRKKYDAKDRAFAHTLPKEAPLLVVDVEETLAEIEPEEWSATNPLAIGVRAGAAPALTQAAAKGAHIVYLAVHGRRAKEYRRVRGWVEIKGGGGDALPRGPVLGRLDFTEGEGSLQDARHALLSELRERFEGPITAVVRTAEAAEQCLQLKIRPIAMGGGDFPEGAARIKSWGELPRALH
jgi:hypothetical protein